MLTGYEKALLALLLIVLMTGMGATLTVANFRNVLKKPKGVLIGLASQFGWMPLCAFFLATWLELPEAMAISLLIVGCTPGGTTSNLYTYYARADLSLSISMTVLSTFTAFALMPLLLVFYVGKLGEPTIEVPYGQMVVTLVLVLLPVCVGMWIRSRKPELARRVERIGSLSGIGVLVLLIVSGLVHNGHLLTDSTPEMFAATVGLGAVGMGLGYLAARVLGLGPAQRRAVALETGIQNSPLAFGIIVLSFPEVLQPLMLWLPLLYALFVLLSALVVTLLMRATAEPENVLDTPPNESREAGLGAVL